MSDFVPNKRFQRENELLWLLDMLYNTSENRVGKLDAGMATASTVGLSAG
jgi:hypothetical protein